ncbi:MAG: PhoH family protein, partial [Kiritimatiellae bacterium]|nr:PhoH family protein [Kiritimatiellia bacterium]
LKTFSENIITFVRGVPGSGKTFLAVAYALQQLFRENYRNIVFTRPVMEAGGERLGFLPGDMEDKIDPYMMPIYNSLRQLIDDDIFKKITNKNGHAPMVQILPLAYMRGVTFRDSIVICDECQNTTPEQIRMLTTRIGEGSKMIVCGDIRQSDIDSLNGLEDAFDLLQDIDGIGFATMTEESIVRHPIIAKIERRYHNRTVTKKSTRSHR